MIPGTYLYQTVHLLDGRCLRLAEHLAVLDRWSHALFGRGFAPEAGTLAREIAACAAHRMPAGCDRSSFVRIEVPAAAEPAPYRLEFAGVSLYRGYDLRSLMPDAVTMTYGIPIADAPTSAREAADALAAVRARLEGAAVAVRCDRDGIVCAAEGAPLFAVAGKSIVCTPGESGVERTLASEAIRAAGLELMQRPVERGELARFEELFYVDHRGVTALAHCDGRPYMAILAERVARAMARLKNC